MPRAWLVLLVAAASCYSPSYKDCQLQCSDTCPSGLVCDPSLHMCRPEGATGACGAGQQDAPTDTTRDVDPDAPGSYCTTVTGAKFCADFDTSTQPEAGWTQINEQGGGDYSLVASTRSPPNALQSATPADTTGATYQAGYVQYTYAVPADWTTITVAFDFKVAVRDAPSAAKSTAYLGGGAGYYVEMSSVDANQLTFAVNGSSAQVSDLLPIATWARYTLELTQSSSSSSIDTRVTRNGIGIGPNDGHIGASVPSPFSGVDWELKIGAQNQSVNGACAFHYDNVVLTVN